MTWPASQGTGERKRSRFQLRHQGFRVQVRRIAAAAEILRAFGTYLACRFDTVSHPASCMEVVVALFAHVSDMEYA